VPKAVRPSRPADPGSLAPRDRAFAAANGLPVFVALAFVFLTLLTALIARSVTRSRDSVRFVHLVEQTRSSILNRFDTHVALLYGVAGLFASDPSAVTRERFRDYIDQLDVPQRYPGIQGLGFSIVTDSAGRDRLIEQMRREGLSAVQPRPAEARQGEVHVILYLEPLDRRNLVALGYDMHTEPVRRAAMDQARDTAQPVASGKVTLVQEIDDAKQAGFLIYLPIYRGPHATLEQRRQNLAGFVYSPLRADDLFHRILAPSLAGELSVKIYDGGKLSPLHLLHESIPPDADSEGYRPRFARTTSMDVAGRTWELVLATRPEFDAGSGVNLAPWILAVGAVVSALLFVVTRSQARARDRAERVAAVLRAREAQLESSESRLRRLVDSNLIGVVFGDLSGRITDGNRESFRIIGRSPLDVLSGKVRWDEITPHEYLDRDRLAVEQLIADGVSVPFEKEFIRPDGSRVPVLIGVAKLAGDSDQTVAFYVDLSERKRIERELEQAKDAAEAANRAKDQFLAVLSHELRTPLTPVLAVADANDKDESVPPALREDFAMIRRNVALEAKLIDDLLDLTSISRGRIKLRDELIDVHGLALALPDVCCREELQSKRLRLTFDLSARRHHVRGDSARLSQILWNLLKNAAKFTPAEGQIELRTRNVDEGDNPEKASLVIEVRDSGIGIDADVLPRIFDAFEQASDEQSRAYGGLGLGLAIARGLVEAHGGQIRADSAGRGNGAVFTVTLPTAPPPALVAVAPRKPSTAPRLRILLVEDHVDTYNAMLRILRGMGHDVTGAHSYAEATAAGRDQSFDLLLSDLGLPDGNGLELMSALRAARNGKHPPLRGIALTGFGMEEDVRRSAEAGFDAHLAKPIDLDSLQSTIHSLFSR
jgi:PAS domain S-box-containing protein